MVVLPWVPATAMPCWKRNSSASISARRTTGSPSSPARTSSGLSSGTAVEMTTTSASSTWRASWPRCTATPMSASRAVNALAPRSEPLTRKPSRCMTSAMPPMPTPPMPMKCMPRTRRIWLLTVGDSAPATPPGIGNVIVRPSRRRGPRAATPRRPGAARPRTPRAARPRRVRRRPARSARAPRPPWPRARGGPRPGGRSRPRAARASSGCGSSSAAPRLAEPARVGALVVVHGVRKRHEDRGAPRGGELGHGHRAAAAHHEVGVVVGGAHVVDEVAHRRLDAPPRGHLGVARAHRVRPPRARLVAHGHGHAVARQGGAGARQRDVERLGPPAAADDQHAQRPRARRGHRVPGRTVRALREDRDVVAHRIADDARPGGERAGEGREGARGDARQHPVGQARHRVLLVQHQRHAREPRGQAHGPRREAAHAQDRARAELGQQPPRLRHGARQPQRPRETGDRALAAQPGDVDGAQLDAGRRHERGLEPRGGADPDDRHAARAQHLGHGEPRHHVAAGAAGRDGHGTRPGRGAVGARAHEAAPPAPRAARTSLSMRSSSAKAAANTTALEPP